jgi:hypothetical protein
LHGLSPQQNKLLTLSWLYIADDLKPVNATTRAFRSLQGSLLQASIRPLYFFQFINKSLIKISSMADIHPSELWLHYNVPRIGYPSSTLIYTTSPTDAVFGASRLAA